MHIKNCNNDLSPNSSKYFLKINCKFVKNLSSKLRLKVAYLSTFY